MISHEIIDSQYGEIHLSWNHSGTTLTILGESIPTSSISQIGEPETRSGIPIGTRESACLRLILDGEQYEVRPGPGRFSRRTYRVHVTGHGQSWLFTPATPTSHRLVQGDRYVGHNEIAMFTADDDGDVIVEWSEEFSVAGVVARKVDPTPQSCALGYLLSAAFGTGAQLMLFATVTAAMETLIPGGI